jgi:hypothetical protein
MLERSATAAGKRARGLCSQVSVVTFSGMSCNHGVMDMLDLLIRVHCIRVTRKSSGRCLICGNDGISLQA